MAPAIAAACPHCGHAVTAAQLVCALCGNVLRREARAPLEARVPFEAGSALAADAPFGTRTAAAARAAVARTGAAASRADPRTDDAQRARLEPWFYFGLGMVTAPVFALTPVLGFMGWFLASLVHEMGHASMAWFFGMPAIPAISLEGHAAAVHGEQQMFLVAIVCAALVMAARRWLEGASRWTAIALALVLYPLLALTGAKDLLHLLAGHGGELVFAVLCLWKALDGGFRESRVERLLYGTVGWFLVGKNVHLCWGLVTSAGARAIYHENGSFGFTNDYLRVADDVLGWKLETVASLMLFASLLVVPAAIVLWRARLCAPVSEPVLGDA